MYVTVPGSANIAPTAVSASVAITIVSKLAMPVIDGTIYNIIMYLLRVLFHHYCAYLIIE